MRCHCELLCQSDCFWAVSVCLVTSGPSGFWLVLVVGLDEGPVRIHNTLSVPVTTPWQLECAFCLELKRLVHGH